MNTLSSIRLGGSIQYIKGKPPKGEGHNEHNLGSEADFKSKQKGKNAVSWGDKIRLNGTPTDSTGHTMQGANDADFKNTYDRAWDQIPKVNDGYIFTKWYWDGEFMGGPITLGSYGDNFGCTPTLKADKDAEDGGRHKLVVYQVYAEGTDREVRSNELEFAID